ncbi:MAG TPA: histidinol-phosphate transaminase [Gallionella sp.]|jgi:histidinol-phosphate aminotransferase|nr:MAG: histidinol-phosphate transaminase [Gallionellales bacterium GWA2_54_124]OGT20064.1 MAG: histidinol-phosphate transaminase [Gallionellales bacterium RIFOXYD12_FULL_53_10]OGT29186.1 MAG: histidinol-phosphate transaminase [Gallionellales bacterium RIFOXYD2_FULL_52_7]HCI52823.1 histidinol-phosphate transaminase [Gallionella sp.]
MSSVSQLVQTLIRPEIQALSAYHVPDCTGLIKLDAMENPYLLPQSLQDEIAQLVAEAQINRYPDPDPRALKDKISQLLGLTDEMSVLLGNGSDELIQLLAMAVNQPCAVLLSVEPSFVMYKMIATFVGMRYVGVPLAADYSLDFPATLEAIYREQPALVFLAYPNNPTGNRFDREQVREIIEASPGLVVIDEAYYAFASDSFIPSLPDYPNLLVMRTFSKLGMAGLRLGFLAGSSLWLTQLEKLRLPYNVGVLPQLVAQKLLDNHDVLLQQAEQIKKDRVALHQALAAAQGVTVYDSEANFLLFRIANATGVFNGLKERGVLIKNLNGGHPMLTDCLRVTVGTPEQNALFLDALQDILVKL